MSKLILGELFVNEGKPVISVMCGDPNDPEIVAMLETNDPMMVANRNDGVDYDLLETYANLFAAAPDLVTALKTLLKTMRDNKRIYWNNALLEAVRNAETALAKAKGETNDK